MTGRLIRVLVVNPNTTEEMTESIAKVARRSAAPDVEVVAISARGGVASVEGHADEVIASFHMLSSVLEVVNDYDAVVVACFSDPALAALREVCPVPVVGIAESAFAMASWVGSQFSIVSVMTRMRPVLIDLVRRAGFESKVASIHCADITVLEIDHDPDRAVQAMIEDARTAVASYGAEAVVLGCAGLGPLDRRVGQAVGVPVLDPVQCGVLQATALVRYGLTTSRIGGYRSPERKLVTGVPDSMRSLYGPGRVEQ